MHATLLTALALVGAVVNEQTAMVNNVYSPGEHGFACFRIPSLVTVPGVTPRLLAFAEARGPPDAPGCHDMSAQAIALKISTDQGRSWGAIRLLGISPAWDPSTYPPTGGVHNPTTVWDDTRRQVILHYVEGTRTFGIQNGTTWQLRSTDLGETFLPRERVDVDFPPGFRGLYPGPGAGISLSSGPKRGRLVFPAFVFAGPHYFPTQESTVLYYSDDATRFQISASKFTHARPADQFDEPAIVERADGSILLSIRSNYSSKDKATHSRWPFRLQAVSTDQGNSFGSFKYATDLPDPSCQASLLRLHGKGPSDERLAFCNPANQTARVDLTVRTSSDGGVHWSKGRLIWPLPSAYSSMAALGTSVDHKGGVAVLFEQYLNDTYDVALVHIGLATITGPM